MNISAHQEGELTKKIEQKTAELPSGLFLTVGLGGLAVAAGLELFTQKKQLANFIGLMTPTVLIMGLYNKLVKTVGSEGP